MSGPLHVLWYPTTCYNNFQTFLESITRIRITSPHLRCLVLFCCESQDEKPFCKSWQVSPLDTREALLSSNSNDAGTSIDSADCQLKPLISTNIHSRHLCFLRSQKSLVQSNTVAHPPSQIFIPSFPSNTFVEASEHGTHQASLPVSLVLIENSVAAGKLCSVTTHSDKPAKRSQVFGTISTFISSTVVSSVPVNEIARSRTVAQASTTGEYPVMEFRGIAQKSDSTSCFQYRKSVSCTVSNKTNRLVRQKNALNELSLSHPHLDRNDWLCEPYLITSQTDGDTLPPTQLAGRKTKEISNGFFDSHNEKVKTTKR